MMEVQRSRITAIAADTARAASLSRKQLPDPSSSSRNRCRATLLAPVVAALIENERGLPMLPAAQHHDAEAILSRLRCLDSHASPERPMCLEPVTSQPVPHPCLAEGRLIGDPRNRHAGAHQRFQALSLQPTSRHMLAMVDSFEPVYLVPSV
jgi:hypothetical protein